MDIHEHGIAVDEAKKRAKCNYCDKEMSGFHRLKHHLAGTSSDVTHCEQVPSDIKEGFKTILLENKKGKLSNEVGQLSQSANLSRKRNCSQPWSSNAQNANQQQTSSPLASEKRIKKELQPAATFNRKTNEKDLSPSLLEVQKSIGRFFYETGINFSAAESSSFQKMVDAIRNDGQGTRLSILSQQFRGTILKNEVNEMRNYVNEIRKSWAETGCSILLDGWTDGDGRNLINILVDCPKGPIYLKSLDVSSLLDTNNVDPLMKILDEVIEDVGVKNVVQIVTYCASDCMEAVGKQLVEKYMNIFWAVSATHCLELILERMGELDLVKGIIEKAKTITKFIYSSATLLKLMRDYTGSSDLVVPSKIRSAVPFLTLENIVSEEEGLKELFNSWEWGSLAGASSVSGKRVADLVLNDHMFWKKAMIVVKATIPIVTVISLIHEGDKPLLGLIYETMDQAKETIEEELKSESPHYMPFWEIIDDIWNKKLHNTLHSAGHFLNPSLFYSTDFHTDAEIATGLLCYIIQMAQEEKDQDFVSSQVEAYRKAKGSFGEGYASGQWSSISPEIWWSRYGGDYPQLRKLAVRVLSQTCDGASKYQLKRSLAEELLAKNGKRNRVEQQRLQDLAFVHYNLQLKNFNPKESTTAEDIDPFSDWIVDDNDADLAVGNNEPSSWMELVDNNDAMTPATTTISTEKKINVEEGRASVFPKEDILINVATAGRKERT